MEKVRAFKEEGNAFFREGQYGRAVDRYNRVLTYSVYMFPEGENELELKSLKVKTHLNMAACHLRTATQNESSAGGGGKGSVWTVWSRSSCTSSHLISSHLMFSFPALSFIRTPTRTHARTQTHAHAPKHTHPHPHARTQTHARKHTRSGGAAAVGGSLKEVHNHCYQALRLDETSAKAHFRRSQAYRLGHKFEDAAVRFVSRCGVGARVKSRESRAESRGLPSSQVSLCLPFPCLPFPCVLPPTPKRNNETTKH